MWANIFVNQSVLSVIFVSKIKLSSNYGETSAGQKVENNWIQLTLSSFHVKPNGKWMDKLKTGKQMRLIILFDWLLTCWNCHGKTVPIAI